MTLPIDPPISPKMSELASCTEYALAEIDSVTEKSRIRIEQPRHDV